MSVQVHSPAHVAISAALSQCLGNIHGSANKASFVIESLTKAGFEIIRSNGPHHVAVPPSKTVPITITLGAEALQAVANIDDIESLRRALARLTTPVKDTL